MAILGILAALMFPVLRSAVESAKSRACMNNFAQIGRALMLYEGDYDDYVPPVNWRNVNIANPEEDRTWVQTLLLYVGDFRVFQCPADSGRDQRPPPPQEVGSGGDAWKKYYASSLRSNLGYNYLYLSPLVQLRTGQWQAFPMPAGRIANPSATIAFIDSVWDRSATGAPFGGGSWVVVPPCRYKALPQGGGQLTDTFPLPEGTAYFFGFNPPGWQPESSTSWLVYGGAWPWHRHRFNLLFADGRTKSVAPPDLIRGCDFDKEWLGSIRNGETYLWDIDE